MKLKKLLLTLCAVLLLAALLTGCGSSTKYAMNDSAPAGVDYYTASSYKGGGLNYDYGASEDVFMEEPMAAPMEKWDGEMDASELMLNTGADVPPAAENKNLKLIYTVDATVETLDYESSLTTIDTLVKQYGGYVEYSQVDNDHINYQRLRSASYTLRIPAEKLDAFMESCGSVGNVSSVSKRTENRTAEYVDLSSRLANLQIEEKSLQELLEKATDLDSIVALHGYLADVRYEIETIQTRMRGIDGLVSYSTVNLYLEEVKVVSDVVTPKSSFGERLSARLHNSWIDFADAMENFGVFALGELPLVLLRLLLILLPFAIVIFLIVLLIRKLRRRRKARKAEKAAKRNGQMPNIPQEQSPRSPGEQDQN